MKTQSEKWFEEFCNKAGITWKRVPEGSGKTPDYELTIEGQRILVEVKEITRNKKEQQSDRLLSKRGYGSVLCNTPGDRVRRKIADSSPQIKALTQDGCPSMLVLCDLQHGCGQVTGHLDPYNIRVGMYGLEQIRIAVRRDHSVGPRATGMSYGSKRKMTKTDNTSISAIAVLSTPKQGEIVLNVYHNKYAAIRLKPVLLARYGVDQYHLEKGVPGSTAKWEKLSIDSPS